MEQFQVLDIKLDIKKVFESPLNPRRTFNEKKMQELVESIRAKGILMPLLVRPVNSTDGARYEIATGHRRYRAAIKVGLKEVPVIIREMNDADFLEVITIENLQREDIEPLDEAQGYRTLMEKTNYDVQAIAAKVGKSESYIYQRIKLLELIPEAQEQLSKEKITAGHAILIARLQPNEQKECLHAIKEESDYGPGMSVRELADHIDRQIHLDLNSASFKKTDPDLVPEAGPCISCPKRTGFMPTLFPDIKKKDTCTDPTCFHKKVGAFIGQWIEKKSQDSDVPPLRLSNNSEWRMKNIPEDKPIPANLYHEITDKKKDSCSHTQEGIVVDEGRNQGRILLVCVDPECKTHHRRDSYSSSPEHLKYVAQQKAEQEKRKNEEKVRIRIIDEILRFLPSPKNKWELSQEDLAFLAEHFFDELWDEYRKKLLVRHEIKPVKLQYGFDQEGPMRKFIQTCSKADLNKLLMEMALIRNIEHRSRMKGDPLLETAKRYGVDPKKIEAEFRAEVKEKKAEKIGKKKKTPAVKQKVKRADPPEAKTIPLKDPRKLHGPVKKKTLDNANA